MQPPATDPARTFTPARDADPPGYRLWLRYAPPPAAQTLETYRSAVVSVTIPADSPTLAAARRQLQTALPALLGREVPFVDRLDAPGTLVVGTTATLPADVLQQLG